MPFYPSKKPQNCWIYHHFTHVYMCTKNYNHMMYGSWDTEWDRMNFLSFWVIFCPFNTPPPHLPPLQNQHFSKIKKTPEDIIILQMCTINDSHMMYGSWNIGCNGQNFFVISDRFLPFYFPNNLTTRKIKILKNEKTAWRYYHFTQMYHTWQSYMMYGSWDMERDGQNFLSFWTIFCTFTPNPKNQNQKQISKTKLKSKTTQNIKILKK